MNNSKYLVFLTNWHWPLRFFVAVMIGIYAVGKLSGGQFHTDPLPDYLAAKTLGQLNGFDLAWRFFGFSKIYIMFIGILQLLGSTLLLFRKTSIIGTFILLPIMVNIVLIDLIYGIPAGATFNALLYTLILLVFIWVDRVKVFQAFRLFMVEPPKEEPRRWMKYFLALGYFIILFILVHFIGNQIA